MEGVEIMKPYELHFSDLNLLSSNYSSSSLSSSSEELDRSESIVRSLIGNLGPNGPGLIAITGVPHASRLRKMLLPLARRLALLDANDRKSVFKEHGLGSDVSLKKPDRIVSSFAMQLKYLQGHDSHTDKTSRIEDKRDGGEQCDLKNLGNSFRELGSCMMELGLSLARICDGALGALDLERSLLESCTAKGRLIHYHSSLDNRILKAGAKRQQSTRRRASQLSTENEATTFVTHSDTWQQWHYDYGIFTILTSPMFILPCHGEGTEADVNFCSSCVQECPSPSGHIFLKIFDKSKNRVQMVKADPDSFIVQVGEAAEILSKGKLRANLHSVSRPEKIGELSRETFVVFLQPRWDKTFSISDYRIESFQSCDQDCAPSTEETCIGEQGNSRLGKELHKIVPPLSSRLKDGMTFAEFSQETTRQYYGGSGLQSER